METLGLYAIAFVCPLIGAALGMQFRRRLPQHHLSREAIDVIKLATGLMASLVALVLGLLVSSANSFHGTVDAEYRQTLASTLQLDQYLTAYGREADEVRALARRMMVRGFKRYWATDDFGPVDMTARETPVELEQRILMLEPATPAQKWFQAQALQRATEINRLIQLMANQESDRSLPVPILVVLLACSMAIFGSFSLFVAPNPTVVASLGVAAFAIASAVFLIVELNRPFGGLLRLSSGPAHAALETLGR